MEGAACWAAYYRSNVIQFCKDYLHLELHLFQKILITMMMYSTVFVWIASRGMGKSFLSAIYCCVRATLYPGSKIVIASGRRGQSINVLEKILFELKPMSPELAAEINDRETQINGTTARIVWRNGSTLKVVTASDSSRSNRANVLLLDEYRLISKSIVDTVLRKFLTQKRTPKYSALSKVERQIEYDKEKNLTLYLSSAYFSDTWAYTKCEDTCRQMLDDTKRQFVCGMPYQLGVLEGVIDRDAILDEMAESNFNEISFSMEYEALWWGLSDGSFFDFPSISRNRHIQYPMLPGRFAEKLGNSPKVKIMPKQNGEKRILSADIALMSSKKNNNDATAVFINQLLPTKAGRYSNNIVYCDAFEGLHTESQALVIRKLFDEFDCDYIVLDCAGIPMPSRVATYGQTSRNEAGKLRRQPEPKAA